MSSPESGTLDFSTSDNPLDELDGLSLDDFPGEFTAFAPPENGEAGKPADVATEAPAVNAAPVMETEPAPKNPERKTTIVDLPKIPTGEFILYFDLETVPDDSRLHLFDLPPLPSLEFTPDDQLMDVAQFLDTDLKTAGSWLKEKNPSREWLDKARETEQAGKNRKGMNELIEGKIIEQRMATEAEGARVKQLSISPLHCRIVSLAFAFGDTGHPYCLTCETYEDERIVLEWFWKAWDRAWTICNFGSNHFDIPVILARSMILGIAPTFQVDLKRYGCTKSLDLVNAIYPEGCPRGGGLKPTVKALGLEDHDDPEDGSQVYGFWKEGRWEDIAHYNIRDVIRARKLHHAVRGYFCPVAHSG